MAAEVVALPHALACALACGVIAHWLLILLVWLPPTAFLVCVLLLLVLSLLIGIALVMLWLFLSLLIAPWPSLWLRAYRLFVPDIHMSVKPLAKKTAKSLSVVCPGHPHVGETIGKKG